jgi:hypothetical protein
MKTALIFVFLFGVIVVGKGAGVPSASRERPVWYWQAGGSGRGMKLEVRLDNKAIFITTLSVARASRRAIPKRSYAKKIRFSFKPERAIVWSGYRDENFVCPAKRQIECDIWMAGADESALILGVSFGRSDVIFMNTLHLASLKNDVRSEIADGLVVVTSPVAEKKPNERGPGKGGLAVLSHGGRTWPALPYRDR